MRISVKNPLADLIAFGQHTRKRENIFAAAGAGKLPEGKINQLSKEIHPKQQSLTITKIIQEAVGINTYRLKPAGNRKLAPFRAGQYLSLSFEYEGQILTRPYSISSTPDEALEENYYEITIKEAPQRAFFSRAALNTWNVGTVVQGSGPAGYFYYEPLRDSKRVICLAGGSGITPFRSIITQELEKRSDLNFHLFYGISRADQEIFKDDFNNLEEIHPGRFSYTPVIMSPDSPSPSQTGLQTRTGVITLKMLQEFFRDEELSKVSLFICGPLGLHNHIDKELAPLKRQRKFTRRESYGIPVISDKKESVYKLMVKGSGAPKEIPALSGETLLTALERAGLNPPSLCRSGECGWCRSQLLEGEIAVDEGMTGLRMADKKFNWIHPCMSYPRSSIVLRVPRNPLKFNKSKEETE